MSPRAFDRVMVHIEIAHHLKLRKLTNAEWKAFLLGVLPIAAKSDIRGALMVGREPATADDIAHQARVSTRVARGALSKLHAVGMLDHDEDLGADWVHDFDEWNPEPKADSTAAERAARYRQKQKAKRDGNGSSRRASRRDARDDHGNVTPPEVEGEEKTPPTPVTGGVTDKDFDEAKERLASEADSLPDDLPEALHGAARSVHERLLRLHTVKPKSLRPPLAAVGRVLLSMPDRDHVAVADDVEHYWTFGPGQNKSMRDVVATYRNRLTTAPIVAAGQNGTADDHEAFVARFQGAPA